MSCQGKKEAWKDDPECEERTLATGAVRVRFAGSARVSEVAGPGRRCHNIVLPRLMPLSFAFSEGIATNIGMAGSDRVQ